jgi:hypothetical protein
MLGRFAKAGAVCEQATSIRHRYWKYRQLDVKRSRLWVTRLKGSLSVEHPIAGDELRAIKRYLATREDNPALVVSCPSGRHSSPARPSIISCGSLARPQS